MKEDKNKPVKEKVLEDSFLFDKEWERISGQKTPPNRIIKEFNLSDLTREERKFLKEELGTTDKHLDEKKGCKLVGVKVVKRWRCFYMYNEKGELEWVS